MLLTEKMTISLTSSCSALPLAASTADWKLILSVLSPSATAELTSHTCLTRHNISPRATRDITYHHVPHVPQIHREWIQITLCILLDAERQPTA